MDRRNAARPCVALLAAAALLGAAAAPLGAAAQSADAETLGRITSTVLSTDPISEYATLVGTITAIDEESVAAHVGRQRVAVERSRLRDDFFPTEQNGLQAGNSVAITARLGEPFWTTGTIAHPISLIVVERVPSRRRAGRRIV